MSKIPDLAGKIRSIGFRCTQCGTCGRCDGLGQGISEQDATMIAYHLLQRQRAEEEEAQRVRQVLQHTQFPSGACVVIDSEGVRVFDG